MDWATTVPPLIGAVCGGGATFAVTTILQRARPGVAVLGCTVSAELPRADDSIEPNKVLLLEFERTPEIASVWLDRYEEISEADYVTYLQDASSEMDLAIRRQPEFAAIVEQLRTLLNNEQFDKLRQLWSDEHALLWTPLITAFSRGEIPDLLTQESETPTPVSEVREREDFILLVERSRRAAFTYDPDDSRQPVFCRRAATALAMATPAVGTAVADLRVLINALETYATPERLTNLKARVSAEIDLYNRLIVSGHVTNTGRLPCTVPNAAALFLFTRGLTRPAGSPPDAGAPETYQDDLAIEMLLVDNTGDEYDYSIPVELPVGGMVPFVAASADPVAALPHGSDLINKLKSGGVKAKFGYQVSAPGSNELSSRYSEEFEFVLSAKKNPIASPPH